MAAAGEADMWLKSVGSGEEAGCPNAVLLLYEWGARGQSATDKWVYSLKRIGSGSYF